MRIVAVEMVRENCYEGKIVVKDSYGEIIISFHGKDSNGNVVKCSKSLEQLNDCERGIVGKITKEIIK